MGKKRKREPFNRKPQRTESPVKAKKFLGQHFLKDEDIAKKIADTLSLNGYDKVLEIGPGTGILTKYLLLRDLELVAMDLDKDSIVYLKHSFPLENPNVVMDNTSFALVEADFLSYDLNRLFDKEPFAITGNFPYNISTQIVFRLLEMREQVPEFSGMFQKEVAQRICEQKGSKTYGILSVLVQAFYDATYLFTVHPQVFDPPPKVQSGVLRLVRKENFRLTCDEKLFFKVVKSAFNQRRKTLRNSLKTFSLSVALKSSTIFNLRPEQLSVEDFIQLTQRIEADLAQGKN
ncbi:16S rRNA (adenine(1518)-N(6)/adenine(1519)-N(6))-dimethyltransferase RsmA [Ulvibacterium sp.]|uniref:16S rRNA (adenine(1518)-N(6)/adenine(1519)-N(6))- dimethyltransferase RsmA n=1 Tax=Ulvibacterium sp. TaxID=2665914 RepID=UPI002606141D|nr:16S rRNA (adenine(1518)-N(6)/adenine(1519)-N(6))-dimethyltransferase RsmA [Ulvibacterium sp.]